MDQQKVRPAKGSLPRKVGRVISIRFDAAYFFQRAVRYLDRYDLPRAEKNFRRSQELEPENAIHHCNLAGVLSEMGQYEESNQILQHVSSELDNTLTEIYFYMANNYANLGDYVQAEKCIVRYLEAEPEGEFAPDAEEMLEILIEDFGGGEIASEWESRQEELVNPQEVSRRLLEEGKFLEATEHLQTIIGEDPESLAPRNNLSLAYFYLGRLDEAISLTEEVLSKDASNIHALCNLAVYFQHIGKKVELETLLDGLSKIYPLHYDHTFKLATTMGILGRHDCAERLFRQLTKWSVEDPAVWHAYAASLCNQQFYLRAEKAWKRVVAVSDSAAIAEFYLKTMQEAIAKGLKVEPVSYQYHIPYYEQFKMLKEHLESQKSDSPWVDPLVRSSLFWALRHGDLETKAQVIQTFSLLNDEEARSALQEFVLDPKESDQLKRVALVVLRHLGVTGDLDAYLGGKQVKVQLATHSSDAVLSCDPKLTLVLETTQNKLFSYGMEAVEGAKETWMQFLEKSLENPPRIQAVESWAAGLAYTVLQNLNISVTQAEIAELFEVSKTTISRTSRHIARILE